MITRLLITGANGFLGSHLCRQALERGHAVRALVRSGSDRSLLEGVSEIEFVEGALGTDTDPASWVDGCQSILHAAAATSEQTSDWELSRRVNVQGTRRLAEAARAAGARRFVFVSSQSAHPGNTSPYGRTKLEAEEALRQIEIPHTILRPGVIYGPERRGIFAKMEETIRKLPVIPIVGAGRYLQYPVHVDDVAWAALEVLEHDACASRTYELGGAEPIAFVDLVRLLMREMDTKKPLLRLPVPVCRFIAFVGERLLANPPINKSNIEGLLTAPPLDIEPARRDFGYQPRPPGEGIAAVWRERRDAGGNSP